MCDNTNFKQMLFPDYIAFPRAKNGKTFFASLGKTKRKKQKVISLKK